MDLPPLTRAMVHCQAPRLMDSLCSVLSPSTVAGDPVLRECEVQLWAGHFPALKHRVPGSTRLQGRAHSPASCLSHS